MIETTSPDAAEASPGLLRRFGLLQSTALNMSNMVGVGPFITIPILMSTMGGGPQALIGWFAAILIVIPDGMVWSELGAAMPGSGGTYRYLREAFGSETFGRLMAFLFIWQFIVSGPLEIASGYVGFANYATYIWPGLSPWEISAVAVGVGVVNIALLYRQITSIGKITVSLWIGTLLTILAVVVTGALHFNPRIAFSMNPGSFDFSIGFLWGLGAATRVGIYDYLGYYDVCYIGDEVRDPARTIPRSIIISVVVVALLYVAINLSVIGVIPWREFVPYTDHPESNFIASAFMERIWGSKVATCFTLMVLWTAFGSVFALLLGYSRIPYAAARDGYFFKVFAKVHPTKKFPSVSLIVIGLVAIACSFASLDTIINAMLTTRILIQFIGQIGAVILLRRRGAARPFSMWLYPVPALLALVGWIFAFVTSDWGPIQLGLESLALGVGLFFLWSWRSKTWPFAPAADRS